MIMNSREKDVQTKQEGDTIDHSSKVPKVSSTSRQWGGLKNPRIVRVSRMFGGKDRHSKVRTIRGLRDRRIRLSVPTAIELYDLQDRLGLNQPSKVVDWLLDAAEHDIDKLPPLQMPPGNFTLFHPPSLFSHDSIATTPQASTSHFFNANSSRIMKDGGPQNLLSSRGSGISINDHVVWKGSRSTDQRYAGDNGNDGRSKHWGSDHVAAMSSAKCKEAKRDESATEQENLDNYGGYVAQLSAQNLFPLANQSSFPGFLNNALPYNSYFHWEPSNLSLSPFGNHSLMASQTEDSHNSTTTHSLALPSSSMAIPSGSHQLYFYPSVPSILPPYPPPFMNTSIENEPRQINHLPFLSSSSQHVLPHSLMPTLHLMNSPVKSFGLNGSDPKVPSSQENDDNSRNMSK